MQRVALSPDAQLAAGALAFPDGSNVLRVVTRDNRVKEVPLHASSITSIRWNADGSGLWIAGAVGGTPAVPARPAVGGKPAVEAIPATGGTAAVWFVVVTVAGEGTNATVFLDAKPVSLDPLAVRTGSSVVDLRPSPDGVRISAIVQNAAKKRSDLYVARIQPGLNPALVTFRRVAPVLLPPPKDKKAQQFTVASAMWQDAEQLVLVARQGTATYSLWKASFDGSDVEPFNTSGLVNISDATVFTIAHGKQMLALDNAKKRQVYSLSGGTWQPVSPRDDKAKVLSLMYPG